MWPPLKKKQNHFVPLPHVDSDEQREQEEVSKKVFAEISDSRKCEELKAEIVNLRQQHQQAQKDQEKQDSEIITTMRMMKNYIEQLEKENCELEQKCQFQIVRDEETRNDQSLQSKNETLKADLEQLKEKDTQLVRDHEFQLKRIPMLQKENASLYSQLEELREEGERLKTKCQSLDDAAVLMNKDESIWKEQIKELEGKCKWFQEDKTNADLQTDEERKEHQSVLIQKEAYIKNLEKTNQDLCEKNRTLKNDIERAKEVDGMILREREFQLNSLGKQIAELQNRAKENADITTPQKETFEGLENTEEPNKPLTSASETSVDFPKEETSVEQEETVSKDSCIEEGTPTSSNSTAILDAPTQETNEAQREEVLVETVDDESDTEEDNLAYTSHLETNISESKKEISKTIVDAPTQETEIVDDKSDTEEDNLTGSSNSVTNMNESKKENGSSLLEREKRELDVDEVSLPPIFQNFSDIWNEVNDEMDAQPERETLDTKIDSGEIVQRSDSTDERDSNQSKYNIEEIQGYLASLTVATGSGTEDYRAEKRDLATSVALETDDHVESTLGAETVVSTDFVMKKETKPSVEDARLAILGDVTKSRNKWTSSIFHRLKSDEKTDILTEAMMEGSTDRTSATADAKSDGVWC